MANLYNKTTAHFWLEFAFYEQAVARVQIIFTVPALKALSALFNDMAFFVFQLVTCRLYIYPYNVSREHSVSFWGKEFRDALRIIDFPTDQMTLTFVSQIEFAFYT